MATIGRATACVLLALMRATPLRAQRSPPGDAIRAEIEGFYRDDRDNRWPDVLSHFWVGKITARWTAPTADSAWTHARPASADSACAPGRGRVLPMTIALIDDRWARVFVTRCGAGTSDEVWMLRVGEAWRIARLVRGS